MDEDDDLFELEMPQEIKHGIVRCKHSSSTDRELDAAVKRLGMNWVRVVRELGGHWTVDAARNRYLRKHFPERVERRAGPYVKRSERHMINGKGKRWTRAEDFTLLAAVDELGHQWQKIAKRLPERTPHSIRNRVSRLAVFQETAKRVAASDEERGLSSPNTDATEEAHEEVQRGHGPPPSASDDANPRPQASDNAVV